MKKSLTFLLSILFLLFSGTPLAGAPSAHQPRLIAIGAPAVEITCALGLEDLLVGRSSWETFPPSILKLPNIGSPYQPDLEQLILLKPDLIVLDGRLGSLAGQMEHYGIEILSVEAYNPNEVIPAVRVLAARFNCKTRGEELIHDLLRFSEATKKIVQRVPKEKRKTGVMLTGLTDQFCVAPKSGCTLLEDAGATNLAAELGQPFPLISREWLALRTPDFLLVPEKASMQSARKREDFRRRFSSATPGLGRIIFMDEKLTFGLRSFLGTYRLAAELYPESASFSDVQSMERHFMDKYFPQDASKNKTAR